MTYWYFSEDGIVVKNLEIKLIYFTRLSPSRCWFQLPTLEAAGLHDVLKIWKKQWKFVVISIVVVAVVDVAIVDSCVEAVIVV